MSEEVVVMSKPWLLAGALGLTALGGCGLDAYSAGVGVYGEPYADYYYPSGYDAFGYDAWAYGPSQFDDPYYHLYPNLEYFAEYRPIYPG